MRCLISGAEESDSNTASSFEEIDPSETADLPIDPSLPQAPAPTQEEAVTPAPEVEEKTPVTQKEEENNSPSKVNPDVPSESPKEGDSE